MVRAFDSAGTGGGTAAPVPMAPDDVAVALTAFINSTIMARGRPIQAGDDLQLAGVDSMALLKILLHIEARFGFWMPDEDLVAENVGSPRALASYICRRA